MNKIPELKTYLIIAFLLCFLNTKAQNQKTNTLIDNKSFLLGMLEYPRIKTDKKLELNEILSKFVFKKKTTMDVFLKTVKKLGVNDLIKSQLENTYIIESDDLSKQLDSFMIFTRNPNYSESYIKVRHLKLQRYDEMLYNYLKKVEVTPEQILSEIKQQGYINPYMFNEKQQISFVLGIFASRGVHFNDKNKNSKHFKIGDYKFKFTTGNSVYLEILKAFLEMSDFEITGGSGYSTGKGNDTFHHFIWEFNVPEKYKKIVNQLIKLRTTN